MDTLPFAQTNFRNRRIEFGFKVDDRRRHLYVVGKSGSGKSKLLELLINSDLNADYGVAIIDPHGDLAEEILRFIPKNRVKDVLYFNVQDDDFPIAFNMLANVTLENKHLIIHGFISIFQKIFSSMWLPGMEHVLRYALLAVLDLPSCTVNEVQKMLTDKTFRQETIQKIKEPSIRNFWANEFLQLQEKHGHKTVTPLINKLGEFTLNPLVQRIVGQKKCNIDFTKIMNEGKILVANLAKGKIGETNCALLGSMLVTKIQETAMARTMMPEEERRDFYLYIDEFQNFASNAFTVILSEARKYRLNLIIAHQYLAQLTPEVRNAAFGNVGSIISFRVGPEDAHNLATEFTPAFNAEDIVNLSIRDTYLKLSVGGKTSIPFSAHTLTVPKGITDYLKEIVEHSRQAYATPRAEVEAELYGGHKEDPGLLVFYPPKPLGPAEVGG
jgi:type IV secretory pathway TraG/TraD family ATPase VirD4